MLTEDPFLQLEKGFSNLSLPFQHFSHGTNLCDIQASTNGVKKGSVTKTKEVV